MNDERTGQLTGAGWSVPAYLRGALRLVTEADSVPVAGERGLFELTTPTRSLTLHLGGEDGPALAHFTWEPDALGWDGALGVGGLVDSLTVREANGLPLAIVSVFGVPLRSTATPYTLPQHRQQPATLPDAFEDGLTAAEEAAYTFLAPDGSALAALAENALTARLRGWFRGGVATDTEGWQAVVALPIVLESVTLFADL